MKNRLLLTTFVVAYCVTVGYAQPQSCAGDVEHYWNQLDQVLDFNEEAPCLIELIAASPQYKAYIKTKATPAAIRSALKDLTQFGSSSGAGGTTNLVSKGLGANVIAAATQYGALTESTSNQTVTVSGALGGIPTALVKQGEMAECAGNLLLNNKVCVSNSLLRILNRFTYGVSFDTSQNSQSLNGSATGSPKGTTQQVTFTANSRQINQITGKVVIIPGSPVTQDQFIKNVIKDLNAQHPVTLARKNVDDDVTPFQDWENKNTGLFQSWQVEAIRLLTSGPAGTAADAATVKNNWENNLPTLGCKLVIVMGGPQDSSCNGPGATVTSMNTDLFAQTEKFAEDFSGWVSAQYSYAESLRAKPVLTFEYDDNCQPNQPDNSTFRLVYGQSVKKWTLTFNGAASIYNSAPASTIPGAGRLRDFQLAGEADYDLGSKLGSGSSAGIAFYSQDQTSPAILNVTPGNPVTGVNFIGLPSGATQVFAKKGLINVAQAKMTIGSSGSGFSFPVAVSWSNRTELITKSVWRGQVGFFYNFDSLFSGK
jgi:hypothetical protein